MKNIKIPIGLGVVILLAALICVPIVLLSHKSMTLDESILSEIDLLVEQVIAEKYDLKDLIRDENIYRISLVGEERRGNFQYDVNIGDAWYRVFVKWKTEGGSIDVYSVRFSDNQKPPRLEG